MGFVDVVGFDDVVDSKREDGRTYGGKVDPPRVPGEARGFGGPSRASCDGGAAGRRARHCRCGCRCKRRENSQRLDETAFPLALARPDPRVASQGLEIAEPLFESRVDLSDFHILTMTKDRLSHDFLPQRSYVRTDSAACAPAFLPFSILVLQSVSPDASPTMKNGIASPPSSPRAVMERVTGHMT